MLIPILQMGTLRLRELSDLPEVTELGSGIQYQVFLILKPMFLFLRYKVKQGLSDFPVKGQIVNIFRLCGPSGLCHNYFSLW